MTTPSEQSAEPTEVPPPVHPDLARKVEKRAWHEAGHAVVTDERGWKVLSANASPGHPQRVEADWNGLYSKIAGFADRSPAEKAHLEPRILDYVDVLVAGLIAEQRTEPAVKRVSEIMTPDSLAAGKPGGDRDELRIAWVMKSIGKNDLDEIRAAEARAEKILDARKDHVQACAQAMIENGPLQGAALDTALGKAPVP